MTTNPKNLIRSMTAFCRQDVKEPWGDLTCEIKSVNHRYLEPSFRLSENLRILEPTLRETLRKRLARGKVEVSIRLQSAVKNSNKLVVDTDLVKQIVSASQEIQKTIATYSDADSMKINPNELLSWPGVLTTEETDQKLVSKAALSIFDETLNGFLETREREGLALKTTVEQKLIEIHDQLQLVQAKLPEIIQRQKEKLLTRLSDIKGELDNTRLEQEMVYLAQKVDVDEELERLKTHVDEVARVLNKGGPSGRRLDFLMQELNREANTLGSKSIDSQSTQASVELKVCIEQMREQIQNME